MFCAALAVVLPAVLKAQTKLLFWLALLICGAVIIGCSLYFFRRQVFQTAFLFCLLAMSFLTLASGFYSQFLADVRLRYSNDRKIPALAVKLKQMLPPASEGDVIRFWYPEGTDTELKMLQSFFLHTFSMLPGGNGFAKYPGITASDADAIRRAGIQQIVLMDKDPLRLDAALNSLSKAGIGFSRLQFSELSLRGVKTFVQRVELSFPSMGGGIPVPLDSLEISRGAAMALAGGKAFLTTSDERWHFDIWSTVARFEPDAKELVLNSKVYRGRVELCLISGNGSLVSAVEIWPTEKPVLRRLYGGKDGQAHTLMIRNKMPDTWRSMVEVSGIELGSRREGQGD